MQYILEQGVCHGTVFNSCHTSSTAEKNPLTEIQEGELYLCLEHRTVRVRERIINLTSKEFDILALLIANPKRVFTYELITDLVWKEDCDFYIFDSVYIHWCSHSNNRKCHKYSFIIWNLNSKYILYSI